ncbi:MAG: TraX family protein [Romboutsia sp.]
MKKLNAFQIKVFALILMLMDHLYFGFPQVFPLWFHPLSRVVAPIFGFLLVEGFFHTRNKVKYNIRLFAWAVFMQVGNILVNTILLSKEVQVHNNIFMTLAIGLAIINIVDFSKSKDGINKVLLVICSILLVPLGFLAEGGMVLIPFILVTYLLRGKLTKQIIVYIILSVVLFIMSYVKYPTTKETIEMLMYNSDFLFILVVPFICLYNGERGLNNKFSKYLFYVFYPLHLWVIAIISFMLR